MGSTLGDANSAPAAPVNTTPPAITGITAVGETLAATRGTWTAGPLTSYAYQWQRCDAQGASCADIAGATADQYTLTSPDADHTLRVRVTADGTVSAQSATTAAVAVPTVLTTPPPAPSPTPEATPTPTPTPTPSPEPALAPKPSFSATVNGDDATPGSGTGTTPSGATAVTVADNGVDVGCRMTGVELASCSVELYADVDEAVARRALASATRRMLVGTGRVEADAGTNRLAVRVELNALGRTLMRRSPTGLDVRVAITGRPTSGAPLKATSTARLVPKTAALTVGGYRPDQSTLPAAAQRALRRLAETLAPGARITVVGHTDNSWRDGGYLRRLGRKRAAAVVRYLRSRGVKATYVVRSEGAAHPVASNDTKSGRARNRRVALTIVR